MLDKMAEGDAANVLQAVINRATTRGDMTAAAMVLARV
jgi:hypothetical protein